MLDEREFDAGNRTVFGDFRLSRLGDAVTLLSVNSNGQPWMFVDQVEFDATLDSVSMGRVHGKPWHGELVPQIRNSFGIGNIGHRPGEIVISEWSFNEDLKSDPKLNFLELYNATGQPIDLQGWRLRGATEFELTDHVLLSAGEALIVVNFNPDDELLATQFRNEYGLAENIVLLGPWAADLGSPWTLQDHGVATISLERGVVPVTANRYGPCASPHRPSALRSPNQLAKTIHLGWTFFAPRPSTLFWKPWFCLAHGSANTWSG